MAYEGEDVLTANPDLVARLREDHRDTIECEHGFMLHRDPCPNATCLARDLAEAADEIERLREALRSTGTGHVEGGLIERAPETGGARVLSSPETPEEYATVLFKIAWQKLGGHYTPEGGALIGAARLLEKTP